MPILRITEPATLGDIAKGMHEEGDAATVAVHPLSEVKFDFNRDEPVFVLGEDGQTTEVRATRDGIASFAALFQLPHSMFERHQEYFGPPGAADLLNLYRGRKLDSVVDITYTEGEGITDLTTHQRVRLAPVALVDSLASVLGPTALVPRMSNSPDFFSLDVCADFNGGHWVGGDPATSANEVGDPTAGGLTLDFNRKLNHAPTLASWLYRLWCTNGATLRDVQEKLDARGKDSLELLADFEALALRLMGRATGYIEDFYATREVKIDNVEREIVSLATEAGISGSMIAEIVREAPSSDISDDPSLWDVLNHVTNWAHRPGVSDGARRKLENLGGKRIMEHGEALRCGHCRRTLGH